MSATYILYCQTGKELIVYEDLTLWGIDAWAGRVIKWERVGKRRKPQDVEYSALPNYVWATMSPHQYYQAIGHKYVYPTTQMVGQKAARGLKEFQKMADEAYRAADEIRKKAQ